MLLPSVARGFGLRRLMEEDIKDDEFLFTLYICIVLGLVVMAGLMSGLTLGLMSLDMVELEVLKRSGTPTEQRHAKIIMPVIKRQHMLLVTLLLCNAAATEALPIFLDRLANPVAAIIISVTVVLVFGEIIPQAICTRYGLKVGAYSAWFVKSLMVLCSPISWPIGKLLDYLLGPNHSALFRRAQLKALVDLHGTEAGFGGTLTEDEVHVIRGALDLTSKTAAKSMTPIDKVFMLSTDDRLDERTLQAILMSGHSRVPVYRGTSRRDIIGLILVKELVLINPSDNVAISALKLRELPRLSADTPMYDMLKLFETGKSHMAVLTRPPPGQADALMLLGGGGRQQVSAAAGAAAGRGKSAAGTNWGTGTPRLAKAPSWLRVSAASAGGGAEYSDLGSGDAAEPVGIITIEDVIEELLQEEIIDETDLFVDNMQSMRVNAAAVTGQLPQRLKQVLNAGLFTPRVGRLGSLPPAKGTASLRLPLTSYDAQLPVGSASDAAHHTWALLSADEEAELTHMGLASTASVVAAGSAGHTSLSPLTLGGGGGMSNGDSGVGGGGGGALRQMHSSDVMLVGGGPLAPHSHSQPGGSGSGGGGGTGLAVVLDMGGPSPGKKRLQEGPGGVLCSAADAKKGIKQPLLATAEGGHVDRSDGVL